MSARRYPPHPIAQIVPGMTDDDYRALKADIKANGLEQPITLYEGKILDGIHRERACAELGITVDTRDWRKRNGQTPVQYVMSMNGHRRHLTAGQRAAFGYRVAEWLREHAARESRPNEINVDTAAKLLGFDHRDIQIVEGKPAASQIAAIVTGVAPASIDTFATLAKDEPKLAKEVAAGKKDLYVADAERKAKNREPAPPPTVNALAKRAVSAGQNFAKAIATLSSARGGELGFTDIWGIWATLFEVDQHLQKLSSRRELPIPGTEAELKRLKAGP